jgi:hypothetical protein
MNNLIAVTLDQYKAKAKLKGAVSNIYGVDHDVLPLDAKPNPDSPYNSGQVK